MPFGDERDGGTLAPRKRVDASPRIRDNDTRRAFQPVTDNVVNVPTTRYVVLCCICAARLAASDAARPLVRARGSRTVHVLACRNCAQVDVPEAGVRGG
jgi:hypothetical protein